MTQTQSAVPDITSMGDAGQSNTHAVFVGPIKGDVTLADGTVYDVSPDIVWVRDLDHAQEVAHLVGKRYESEGHPAHMYTGVPFKYDEKGSKENFKQHRARLRGEGE
jgi:hypothetical protein